MPRLHIAGELSIAELSAARLDGDLYTVDTCWASVAEPEDPGLRAEAFAAAVPDLRLVAERLSAAWIWGARSRPPARHQVCLRPGLRARGGPGLLVLRQTDVSAEDLCSFGSARVTAPERTIADLLRTPAGFGDVERDAVVRLTRIADAAGVLQLLEASAAHPHGRRALHRWAALDGGTDNDPGRSTTRR